MKIHIGAVVPAFWVASGLKSVTTGGGPDVGYAGVAPP